MKKLFQTLVIIGICLSLDSCYNGSIYEPITDDNDVSAIEQVTLNNEETLFFVYYSNCHDVGQNTNL